MTTVTVPTHSPAGRPIPLACGKRYDQLLSYIAQKPSLSVLEIGVARADNLLRMMAFADYHGGAPNYVGVDLFGSVDDTIFQREIRTPNKRPMTRAETMDLVREMLGEEIAVRVTLLEGFSGDILRELARAELKFDLIFIDGGHSYEVARDDWEQSQHLLAEDGVIVFDDYPNYGVGRVVREIDPTRWQVRVLEKTDRFTNIFRDLDPAAELDFQLVEVRRHAA